MVARLQSIWLRDGVEYARLDLKHFATMCDVLVSWMGYAAISRNVQMSSIVYKSFQLLFSLSKLSMIKYVLAKFIPNRMISKGLGYFMEIKLIISAKCVGTKPALISQDAAQVHHIRINIPMFDHMHCNNLAE